MGIYDDAKANLGLVAAVAITSFGVAWGAFEGYSKVAGVDRVPANTYLLLKDLRDSYIPRADHDKVIGVLQKRLDDLRDPSAQLETCSASLQKWQTGLTQWRQATENCQATLASTSSNCSILNEVKRLERQKQSLENDAWTLSSSGVNGNPNDGISKNNQIKLENVQRAIRELETRALEVTKRLSCGQQV